MNRIIEKLKNFFNMASTHDIVAQDRAAFDAVNQKAAAILRKITAYDVLLIPLKNDTSSYPIYWFKKKGEKWLYYNRERGELDTSIWAENDDEMVYSTVFGSLDYYALQHFVMWRERNGKDPYRKYDDFMEECLHIVYPERKFRRHPEYDDRKYAELDADYHEGSSPSSE